MLCVWPLGSQRFQYKNGKYQISSFKNILLTNTNVIIYSNITEEDWENSALSLFFKMNTTIPIDSLFIEFYKLFAFHVINNLYDQDNKPH